MTANVAPVLLDEATSRPARASVRLTAPGRAALPLALVALLVAWGFGGIVGLIAATTYALLALAPLCAWLTMRKLVCSTPAPAQVFAGEPFVLAVTLENRARFLVARDLVLSCSEERGSAGRPAGHVPELRPRERKRVHVAHRLAKRGRVTRLTLRARSSWPLGLALCELGFEHAVELTAFPRLGSLADLGRLPRGPSRELADRLRPRHGEEEFQGVREWREGESLRRVHWKLSARRGHTIVREYRQRSETPLELLLATCIDAPASSRARQRAFEAAVSLAATLAEHHLRRERRVRLTLCGVDATHTVEGAGRVGLLRILVALALVEVGEGAPLEALARTLARSPRRAYDAIAVVAARRVRPDALSGRAQRIVLLDVDDPASELVFQHGRSFGTRPPVGRASVV